ncbi:uncharacterized protein CLUP02_06861 [Colletotrichum lupini]|uniref:Uncharacterized protein n=1 Tax=Colletotrichum lupini TaxID=145971 RepID=A0A9Q8SQ67_9PEZI|nr:uncharacterized protein CLUP02_06861 [Colletotrichum lupini]UQC81375.1 hypothetical protein CLUP02_06861 [Colletotrichum lupini]
MLSGELHKHLETFRRVYGWTTACSTDVTETSGKTHAQTWCCPSGWGCLSASNGGIPHRECTSLLSTPTEVWINNVVTTRESESTITTSWTKVFLSNLPRGGPIIINHPVFPLYGKVPPRQVEGARETSLSGGAIAGIVVGIVVILMALIGCSWSICLKKRKQERGTRLLQRDTAVGRGEHSFASNGYPKTLHSWNATLQTCMCFDDQLCQSWIEITPTARMESDNSVTNTVHKSLKAYRQRSHLFKVEQTSPGSLIRRRRMLHLTIFIPCSERSYAYLPYLVFNTPTVQKAKTEPHRPRVNSHESVTDQI